MMGSAGNRQEMHFFVGDGIHQTQHRQPFLQKGSIYFDENVGNQEKHVPKPERATDAALRTPNGRDSIQMPLRISKQKASTLPRGFIAPSATSFQLAPRTGLPPLLPEPDVSALKCTDSLRGPTSVGHTTEQSESELRAREIGRKRLREM
jgi:hypothetical protein